MLPAYSTASALKVAIVSDTMLQSGGAERVVEAIAEAFPDAPVFTILYDPERGPRSIAKRISQRLEALPQPR
jgi:hypothetical protein